jgi:hypothetical protein
VTGLWDLLSVCLVWAVVLAMAGMFLAAWASPDPPPGQERRGGR